MAPSPEKAPIMSTIFPGMDPYLEDPQLWPGVHNSMVVYLRDHLQNLLGPNYIAAVEERVFVEGTDRIREVSPDVWIRKDRAGQKKTGGGGAGVAVLEEANAPLVVRVPPLEIHESYVTILDRRSGQQIVTVIELVSPTNKFSRAGPRSRTWTNRKRYVTARRIWSRSTCSAPGRTSWRFPGGRRGERWPTIT